MGGPPGFCWGPAQGMLKRLKALLCSLHWERGHTRVDPMVKIHCVMVTKAIPELPTKSSEATLPLQSHQVDGDLNLPSPLHHLLFWSYSKFTPATGTNEEGLWVWKISLLKLQQSKTQGSATHEWRCPDMGQVRQVGLPSHSPEVSSRVIPAGRNLRKQGFEI